MMGFFDRYFVKRPKFRRLLTRLLAGDRDVDVSLLGASIRINTIKENGYLVASRLAGFSALLRDEVPTMLNLACILEDGDTFVDIGANVGVYCLTLARMKRVFTNTRFYAFEANPDTFSRLAQHAKDMGVIAHNVALSDRAGTLEFVGGAVSHVFTTVENMSSYSLRNERTSVPCVRLDQTDIAGDSMVLKIDVEGQERSVIDGASGFFKAGRIRAVYLDGYKDRSIEEFLKGEGFSLFEGRTLAPTEGGVFSLFALRQLRAT